MIHIRILKENKQILQELDYDAVLSRFESKKFKKAYEKYRKLSSLRNSLEQLQYSFEGTIPEDILQKHKAQALNWVISLFIRNPLLPDELWSRTSAFNNETKQILFKMALETFFQIKEQKLDRFLKINDLNKIADPDTLFAVVKETTPLYKKYLASKVNVTQAEKGQKLIYSDSDWDVYIPETKAAACKLGKGTEWCTAAPGLSYYEE